MKFADEFSDRLKERYSKLYGGKNCQQKIERDRKALFIKAAASLSLLAVLLIANILSSFVSDPGLRINRAGEITEITRPSKDKGAFSFNTEVEVDTKDGSLKREYFVTIEPAGSAGDKQGLQSSEILPEKSEEDKLEDKLQSIISKLNADTASKKVLLPKKLETGEKLTWTKAEESNAALYIMAFISVLLFLYKNRFYAIEKEERQAKESIIRDLPEFINKLVLLLNAGSVLTTAFLKTMEDSRRSTKKNNYFYQQLNQIARSVKETNSPLHEELRDFSRRSGVNELIRITGIINDNISKGAELSEKLKQENELLWFSRKQHAEEKGRLAETKLTMPLMILLLVLIMITVAPALMEI
ncbi:MAG: hypothetical protein HFE76_13625 [Firmicutes bacterium]|nr:hypothetical protein [Bacillota bacterium]